MIRHFKGVPTVADFGGGKGQTLIVNCYTGKLYGLVYGAVAEIGGGEGSVGPQGPAGPQGPKGETGDTGPQGQAGAQGQQGIQGPPGADGAAGPQGEQGQQGIQGIQGIPGTNGTNGTNGQGVPVGGSTGQVLTKTSGVDFETAWQTPSGGSPFMFEGSLVSNAATGANVTPISLTGLVFTFEANSRYWIEFQGAVQAAAATTGSGFQLDTSVAVTRVGLTFSHQLANTGTVTGGSSIADDASVGVSTGRPSVNVDTPTSGTAYLISGANGGTAQLRYRSEVAAVSTVMAGFMMRVRKLP